jgi:flagellar hook assembly protein FlgD
MELALPTTANVDLAIYDAAGRQVASLLHGELPAGRRSVTWDGRDASGRTVASGLYFARLITPHGTAMRRIVRMD